MSLLDQARADIEQITSNADDFGVSITFLAPDNVTTITINGLHTKHHLGVDTDGNRANVKNAHISFAESLMIGYPIRNAAGEVNLAGHKVTVKDSTGVDLQYIIREWYPDETVGLIVCILGDFE
jgi:hypothetical protein